MTGSQGHRIVEEEDRGPAAGAGKWRLPAAELGHADDPQRTPVMAHDLAGVIDQASPVTGEETSLSHGVEISPRIDPVAQRHHRIVARTLGAAELEGR
jgi:hypothetical protein